MSETGRVLGVVIKPWSGVTPGQILDATYFRNRDSMFAVRILRRPTPTEIARFDAAPAAPSVTETTAPAADAKPKRPRKVKAVA